MSASDDKIIRVWSAATDDCKRTMRGHTYHVTSAAFSTDGQKIA